MYKTGKKAIALILAIAAALCCVCCGCNLFDLLAESQPSETYIGSISESEYSSKLTAIKSYVYDQFSGNSDAVYKSHSAVQTLNNAQVEDLGISEIYTESFSEVEEEEVVYSYYGDAQEYASRMYVVSTTTGYRYYAPRLNSGENLTNSYIQSVMASENYCNCTANVTTNGFLNGLNIAAYTQLFEFDNDKGHIDQKITGLNLEVYFEEKSGRLKFYTNSLYDSNGNLQSVGDEFYDFDSMTNVYLYFIKGGSSVSASSLTSVSDLCDFIFSITADASYFVKTDDGFTLTNESYAELFEAVLGDDLYEEFLEFSEENQFKIKSEYVVSDGRLSKIETIFSMITEDDETFYYKSVTQFSQFGTTQVTLPEIKE